MLAAFHFDVYAEGVFFMEQVIDGKASVRDNSGCSMSSFGSSGWSPMDQSRSTAPSPPARELAGCSRSLGVM